MTKIINGFTLIELLVVVLIIGVLAAIAVPQYQKAVERARVAKALPLFRAILDAQQRYYLEAGQYQNDADLLDITVPYDTKTDLNDGLRMYYESKDLNGYFIVYTSGAMIAFGSNAGYNIDFRKTSGASVCYPARAGGMAESLCASIGVNRGTPSVSGTNTYNIKAW
jgi:prepilin-type N-terminal cleavage/methylation domain-containing protein